MNDYLARSYELLGNDKINSFADKTIMVIGLGGVGGTALEALARSGFKHFILVDFDTVDVSNLNRQILYTSEDVGKLKTEIAAKRMKQISSDIECEIVNEKICFENVSNIITNKVNFIIDAIDYVPGKLGIYKFCLENSIKFISSLGMGNRLDPEKVFITNLNKTENDPLAKKIRYEARKLNLDIKNIPVVFSKEDPAIKTAKPSSMIMVPSTAGLIITKYVVDTIK